MNIKEAIDQVLKLIPLANINSVDDILNADETEAQLILNHIESTRNMGDLLNESKEKELNLFNKDYFQLLTEAVAIAQQEFVDSQGNSIWTDFRTSNIGMFFLELIASEFDKDYFLSDRMFAQFSTTTMTLDKYLFLRSNELGHEPILRKAASTTLRFRLGTPRGSVVTIPIVTKTSANNGLVFETTEEVELAVGERSVDVSAKNYSTAVQNITFQGEPSPVVILDEGNVLDETFGVVVEAVVWERQLHFFNSVATDNHFVVDFLDDERASIRFGNGNNGRIPLGDATITYKFGGGATANNLQIGQIITIDDEILDSLSEVVEDITVNNITVANGGSDRPPMNDQVAELQKTVQSLFRTVTLRDYELNAESIQGVARTLALDITRDSSIPIGTIVLYIVTEPDVEFDEELENNIEDFFDNVNTGRPKPHDKILQINEANFIEIDLEGTVFIRRGFNTGILASIKAAYTSFFDPKQKNNLGQFTIDWGKKKPFVYLSQLDTIAHEFEDQGVRNIDFTDPSANVSIPELSFPILGSMANLIISEVDDGS